MYNKKLDSRIKVKDLIDEYGRCYIQDANNVSLINYYDKEFIVQNKNNINDLTKNIGIYFLLNNNDIVYIGQSRRDINERILTHYKEKTKIFNSYFIIHCEIKDLDKLENEYIFKYTPKYNKALKTKDTNIIYTGKYVNDKSYLHEKNINYKVINKKTYIMRGV